LIARRLLLIALCAAAVDPARAADSSVTVQGGATSGVAAINLAAGNLNQQANSGVIAATGSAAGGAGISQTLDAVPGSASALAANIAPGSFAGSSGWLAINAAAGSGNQQANLAIIALGTTGAAMSDTALSQARASNGPTGGPGMEAVEDDRSAAIGDGAFANSDGLVQVSLIGGDRNTSANVFALAASAGAGQ
jgi:hypothetical protein